MDYVIYMDLVFLINFWMNLLVLFLVRKLVKTYRTFWCIISAGLGAAGGVGILFLYLLTENSRCCLLQLPLVILMNLMAFGKVSLLWHLFLFLIAGACIAGVQMFGTAWLGTSDQLLFIVPGAAFLACIALEKQCRIRWKEEHMKVKTVLEFEDRKMCATALMDTGNRLYDPFYHKPVILVSEHLMGDIMKMCKEKHPERMQYIPYSSVGKGRGMLEGVMFDRVSIQWQEKRMQFQRVIAAVTKENLYKGKEYQIIFHCGLLEEP